MMRERFVRSFDGTELYVSVHGPELGSALPIVLCDGLGCAGFIWRHLLPELETSHTVVRWHYRGHGLSKPPATPDTLTIEAFRDDLAAVMTALGLEQAVLMGHSLGAQVILEFAVTHPERTLGVVPVCGSYGNPLDTFHDNGTLGALFPYVRDVALSFPSFAQKAWRTVLTSEMAFQAALRLEVNGRFVRRKDFLPYFEHMSGMDAGVFIRLLDGASTHTTEPRLGDVSAPTLVIAGEHDTFTPVWLSERMQSLIPEAELLVVPGGTHVAPIEIPELVNLRIERFLRDRVLSVFEAPQVKMVSPKSGPRRVQKATGTGRRRKQGA